MFWQLKKNISHDKDLKKIIMLNETDNETSLTLADHDLVQLRGFLSRWVAILKFCLSVSAHLTINCYVASQFYASSISS